MSPASTTQIVVPAPAIGINLWTLSWKLRDNRTQRGLRTVRHSQSDQYFVGFGKKINQIKKVKMTLGSEDMKNAFGPIAKHYLPEEFSRFCEED